MTVPTANKLRRWQITRRQAWLLRTSPFGGYR